MDYIKLLREEYPIIGLGVLLTFFSSFGQTFLISLYLPEFLEHFQITEGQYGTYYAIATVSSAACLLYVGKLLDRTDLLYYTLMVCAGMIVACLILASANHWIVLIVGIWGLRLSGQGLMSHISMTTMGRYFEFNRGKAVSVASMGHALGEFAFPVAITAIITGFGWRSSLMMSAGFVLLVLVPIVFLILYSRKKVRTPPDHEAEPDKDQVEEKWNYGRMLRDRRFWVLVPSVFIKGFLITALFFFQVSIADFMEWSREWMAGCIMAFAIFQILASLLGGPMIDKWSARILFPFHLLPLAFGVSMLLLWGHPYIGIIYFGLMGISMGFGNTVKSAAYAELFGTRSLGLVRSLFTVVMVFSTALGPVIFGWLLDFDVSFFYIFLTSILVVLLIAVTSFPVQKMSRPNTPQP